MTRDESAAHMRALKDSDLEFILSTQSSTSNEAIAASLELSRRETRRKFWLGIARIVLILSIVAIAISLYAGML